MNRIEVDRSKPGVAIVALIGEHELYSVSELDGSLEGGLAEGRAIVVDLSRADFIDSSVLAALLRAHEAALQRGVRLALVVDDNTGWAVRQILETTGLSEHFAIASNRDDAISGAA